MPIALSDKIVALLCSLTDEQIEALPPAERRRLEHACMAIMVKAAVPRQPTQDTFLCDNRLGHQPSSGILADLRKGNRDE